MAATVRRRPNAFNLLFQMKLLAKMGCNANAEACEANQFESVSTCRLNLEICDTIAGRNVEQRWRTCLGLQVGKD